MANSNLRHLYANAIEGVLTTKNYIRNAFAAENANLWNLYADAAANIPVDGTGGTATGLTLAASSSSPLEGDFSFLLTQANSTSLQGKGVSTDFTIDNAALSGLFTIKFDFLASNTFVPSDGITTPLNDGTTSTNAGNSDIEVFIYDITNAALIAVNPSALVSRGNGYSYKGTFQTAANSNSYRLIFHVATTSANATGWTFKFDNVFAGRLSVYPSFPGSDFSTVYSFVPSAGFGTTTNGTYSSRRMGDSLEVKFSFKCGSVAGSVAALNLPTGLSIDASKLSANVNGSYLSTALGLNTSTETLYDNHDFNNSIAVFYDGSDISKVYFAYQAGGTSGQFNKVNVNTIFSTNEYVTSTFTIPILGWSSVNDITTETDLRTVAFQADVLSNQGTGGNVSWDTVNIDTHNAYSSGTYTVPISGLYYVQTQLWITSNAAPAITISLNGSTKTESFFHNVSNNSVSGGSSEILLKCVAGDAITVQVSGGFTLDGGLNFISIFKISGASTLINSNIIAARASGSMSGTTAHTPFIFPTVDFDTNGAYNTSTGQYRVPVSGFYEICGAFFSGSAFGVEVWKNGVFDSVAGYAPPDSGSTAYSTLMKCIAGDLITVVPGLTTGTISNSNLSVIRKV